MPGAFRRSTRQTWGAAQDVLESEDIKNDVLHWCIKGGVIPGKDQG